MWCRLATLWHSFAGAAPQMQVTSSKERSMIAIGIILIILGLIVSSLKVLLWIGIVVLVIGLILNFVPIGGRTRRWY